MNELVLCPYCSRIIGVVITTKEPFYKCECGYDSRNIKIVISNSTALKEREKKNAN
jgi:hypothetical protein